jgi:hypothetical protein
MARNQTQVGSTYNVVALPFAKTDIGNANAEMSTVQGADQLYYTMPANGAVIGVSFAMSGTLTTGTLTLVPTKNTTGTLDAFTDTVFGNQVSMYEMRDADAGDTRFAAGDTIGLQYTKDGTVAPTTRDATALLFVLLEEVRY